LLVSLLLLRGGGCRRSGGGSQCRLEEGGAPAGSRWREATPAASGRRETPPSASGRREASPAGLEEGGDVFFRGDELWRGRERRQAETRESGSELGAREIADGSGCEDVRCSAEMNKIFGSVRLHL